MKNTKALEAAINKATATRDAQLQTIETLERQQHAAQARTSPVLGLGHDDEAATLGRQLSAARGALPSIEDELIALHAQRAIAERHETAAEREKAALAEQKRIQAVADGFDASIAAIDQQIEATHAAIARHAANRPAQDELIVNAAMLEMPDGRVIAPKLPHITELARVAIPLLGDRIAGLRELRAKHIADRDAALHAADEARRAALAAHADRMEGEFAAALPASVKAAASYVKAYRAAHGQTPPALPDLRALAEQAANDEATEDEQKRDGLMARLLR